MLVQPVGHGQAERRTKPSVDVIALRGGMVLSAVFLSVALTAIVFLCINRSARDLVISSRPSSQTLPVILQGRKDGSGSSRSYAKPMGVYPRLRCCPDLSPSAKSADRHYVGVGHVFSYTIVLVNQGDCGTVHVSDAIPTSAVYIPGSVWVSSSGQLITDTANCIEWQGWVQSGTPVTIMFPVTIAPGTPDGKIVSNTAWIGLEDSISRTATVTVDAEGPRLWECTPSGWVTTLTPTCMVQGRDLASGLDVESARYRYSTDGGASWDSLWLTATCSGDSGTTEAQTCVAASVPFGQDSETMNVVEFSVSDMVGHKAHSTCGVPIDIEPPLFGRFNPRAVVTGTRAPTCTVLVSDVTSGLDVNSAEYRYSTNGKFSGNDGWLLADCSGVFGTTRTQTITAANVSFNHNGSTSNQIQFRISDAAGNSAYSPYYSVSISVPYTVYLPFTAKNYAHPFCNGGFERVIGEFATCWERDGALSVSITDTLSNGEQCYSGSRCALLGSPDYPCEGSEGGVPLGYGRVCQTFGVSSTGNSVLSFWYRIFSYDELKFYAGTDVAKFDSFEVYIDDIAPDETSPIRILVDGSEDDEYGCDPRDLDITDWKESPEFDLSVVRDGDGGTVDYRGKAVELCFYVYSREANPRRTVGWFNTWVYLDEVQIEQD